MITHRKPQVPLYYWPIWTAALVIGLVIFYGIFTPGWLLIRFGVWLGEKIPWPRARHAQG